MASQKVHAEAISTVRDPDGKVARDAATELSYGVPLSRV
jgi:hypothetical protein